MNKSFTCKLLMQTRIFFVLLLLLLVGVECVSAANRYSVANGSWSSTSTWASSSGGAAGKSVPVAGDVVYIENGYSVTVGSIAAACATLNISSGSTLNVGAYSLTVSAATSVTGTINFTSGTGTKTLTGDVTLNSGAVWIETAAAAFTFGGSLINNATTFTASTGVHTFSGGTKTLSGLTAITIPSATFTGAYTNSGTLICSTALTVTGVTLTNNGTITATTALSGTGNLTQGAVGVLNIGGTSVITTLNALATGNTVNYTGAAQSVKVTTYDNLTLSGSGIKTFPAGTSTVNNVLSREGSATTLLTGTLTYSSSATLQYKGNVSQTTANEFPTTFNGTGGVIVDNINGVILGAARTIGTTSKLTLTNGTLTTTSNLLTVNNTAIAAITGGSTTSFINGPVKWTLPSPLATGSTYQFPVGSGSTYMPFLLVNPITTGAGVSAQVQATLGNSAGKMDTTLTSLSNTEYWSLTTTGTITNSSVSVYRQAAIAPLDAIGTCATLGGIYTSLEGTPGINVVSNSNPVAIGSNSTRYFVFGKGKPSISISKTSLTGFNYPVGFGPSDEQNFTVKGASLTTNIEVYPAANYEISTATGAFFTAKSKITLYVENGKVPLDTIYVRMIAGLPIGSVLPGNISCMSDSAKTRNIVCSGTVSVGPVITVPAALTAFSYTFTAGPSPQQSFVVSGTNLSANITVTPSASFEISTTSGSGFVSTPVTVTSGTPIYVRMKIALGVGSYAENIVLSTTKAIPVNVLCSGTVINSPTINTSKSALVGFIYSGAGPSAEQSFTVTGSYLTGNIIVTPPASNFEISTTSGSGFGTAAIPLTKSTGGTVSATIYVRLKASLTAPLTISPVNLAISSTGATTQNVTLSGAVVNTATVLVYKATLSGFTYFFGQGPSAEQSFTVSGALLTKSIVITAPTDFEISTTSGSGYVNSITLANTATVNPTTIYVRLKSGRATTTYSETISCVSDLTKTVTCNGEVSNPPTVTASISPAGPICPNTTVTLNSTITGSIVNQYWEGPNGFYSTVPNPSLGTLADVSKNGTYTVTANAVSGPNLISNGDFEEGNTAFGSSYTYVAPASNVLYPEGYYTVVANPYSVHDQFVSDADNTPAPGVNQMVVNGAPTAGVVVWSETATVQPNTSYQFIYYIQTVALPSPSQLQLFVNGVISGPVNTAPASTGSWVQFTYNVSPGNTTTANLQMINLNTATGGNDFALDDIVFRKVTSVKDSVVVTEYPTVTPAVSITASTDPLYSGGSVIFTATPVNGGAAPQYQWRVNGTNSGAITTSSTFTYTPATGDVISCVMTSNYPCTSVTTATSNSLTANKRTNFWKGSTGANGTDWGTTTNWTANIIPAPGTDVEYATVGSYGTEAVNDLVLDQDRTIGNLVNNTTTVRALIIPAGRGLIVNGTISTDGNPNRIIIKSTTSALPLVANGSLTFHNTDAVNATVEMYSKAYMTALDYPYKFNWQYFGIPVSTVKADPTFTGSYVRRWNEAGDSITNHWLSLGNDDYLTPFLGYEICQPTPKVISFQGQLINSNYSVTSLSRTSTALFPGQHVFANPYTTAIDIRQLVFGSDTEPTVYLYNTGAIGTWNDVGGTGSSGTNAGQYISVPKNTAGASQLPRQVPSMGAMIVKSDVNNSANATFNIPYSAAVMNNADPLRAPAVDGIISSDLVCTRIDVKGTNSQDCMWLFVDPSFTRGFDKGWDGQKMLGSSLTPQLYAVEKEANFQVDAVDDLHNTDLAFQAGVDVEYTMTFTHQNLEKFYAGVYLFDKVENKTIDITTSGTEYDFVAETTPEPVKRFKIVTRPYEKDASDAESLVKIFSSQGTVFVQNFSNLNGECRIYDIAGHYLMKVPYTANSVTAINSSLRPGAYVAVTITGTEKLSKRLIVQ